MHYVTVFDASAATFPYWWWQPIPPLAAALWSIHTLFWPPPPEEDEERRAHPRLNALFVLIVAGVMLVVFAHVVLGSWLRARHDLRTGACRTIAGRVTGLHPLPSSAAKGSETFTVAGVTFGHGNYNMVPGYNLTVARGSPIREGLPVRICYTASDGILKLEIAR